MNEAVLKNKYKISIIMPVYNTEEYFDRCIKSVLDQSYSNMEIIVVDDCSPGNIREKVRLYMEADQRVKIVSHEKNEGLFKARLTGARAADGDYIAFIDSDDYVSMDYYHTLLDRAVTACADIVIGHTVHQEQNGYQFIYNLHEACFYFDKLKEETAREKFFAQKGQCYAWHTVWNKLYSKKLWDQCMPYYERLDRHIIMTEDIAFSSVLFYFAHSVATVSNDAYFYCANDKASTNADHISFRKFEKNMQDMTAVFDFVDCFLKEQKAPDIITRCFHEFRKMYARMWNNIPTYQMAGADVVKARKIMKKFCPEETSCATEDDRFFSIIKTTWNGGLESIKESIIKSQDTYISFDIFDTLIKRPFDSPADLFDLIDKDFEQLVHCNIKFRKIREDAEAIARQRYGVTNAEWQDINIHEIYQVMGNLYHIPADITSKLMRKELELELKFCSVRNAGRELYEAALLSGKQIIIISDMYLDRETIETILENNGYKEYYKLYVSSEIRLTKNRGSLYKYVHKELELDKHTHIYHVGDTWQNDYVNSQNNGFEPIFLPKAKEIFENKIQGVITNACAEIGLNANGNIIDRQKQRESIGLGCMYAVVYNKYFDNPYRSFHPESDLNADPYFIGFYTLGMHLMGLSRWISETGRKSGAKKIHFLARDGYLPMKAYEIWNTENDRVPKAGYIYASRKAVLPGMIKDPIDYYGLPVEYRNHSPETLLKILEFASSDMEECQKEEIFKKNKIPYHKVFMQKEEYLKFIDIFLEQIYDAEKYKRNYEMAKSYYSQVKENDIAFDMGYSGRIQNAVSKLLGRGVNVLFVHSDNDMAVKMTRLGEFEITSYYDFIPAVSGLLREHMLSDYHAGCVGFRRTEKGVEPILEKEEKTVQDIMVLDMLQQGALDFVAAMKTSFERYLDYIPFRNTESSMPFEGYLRNAKQMDIKIFAASYFEDFVYGAAKKINIEQFILNYYGSVTVADTKTEKTEQFFAENMRSKNKIVRAIIFFLLDRELFSKKMANELRNKPILYRFGKWVWNLRKKEN